MRIKIGLSMFCIVFIFVFLFSCKSKSEFANKKYVNLRSEFKQIDDFKDIKEMILKYDFFDKRKNRSGSFKGRFKEQVLNDNTVILDFKTKLMWMAQEKNDKSWARKNEDNMNWLKTLNYKDAEKKIVNLNKNKIGYAGYNDWRMPTVEEAASLLRKQKNPKSLYLPNIFSIKNKKDNSLKNTLILYIWTGDHYNLNINKKKNMIWTVSFAAGGIFRESYKNPQYLRLVRKFKTN